MKQALRTALAALGRDITPAMIDGTRKVYANRVRRPSDALCSVLRDCAYGPHERHRLDLFIPVAPAARPRPVLVFVHGGGFVAGDKGGPDDAFFNNIGSWAADQGFVAVTLTYRLAPAAPWPAGIEDLERAMAWLQAQLPAHGGDPAHIVLMGQSAGAVHVAGYIASRGSRRPSQIAAAVMVSGLYDLTTLAHSPREHAYFGTDASRFVEQSPLPGLLRSELPCLYVVAELDPPSFQAQAAQLVRDHLAARGQWPRMQYLSGHNHLSTVMQIGSPDDDFGPELRSFVKAPHA